MRSLLVSFVMCSVLITWSNSSQAGWVLDGSALSKAGYAQGLPTIVSDGSGGGIVTWADQRNGTDDDIYVRRVNLLGVPLWTGNGVTLCSAAGDQSQPQIVSDGAGGAIVVWQDNRNGINSDIYIQRVNSAGVPQWTTDGIALCTATGYQLSPAIVSDGAGGALVTWRDTRSDPNGDIYIQRVSASGAPQWTAGGVALCTAANTQANPMMASDMSGGAIIAWWDGRSVDWDIYSQRVNSAGVPQWTTDGVALCTAAGDQINPTIASDGAGGWIVSWMDTRNAMDEDVYAQRVSASGVPQWTANGVALCTATGDQTFPAIVSDGAGGAIVAWADERGGALLSDVYAQRVSASGTPQWTANGVALCTAADEQFKTRMVPDGAGGAIVTWIDARGTGYDIYVQRVSASGAPQWTTDGVALCTAARDQFYPTIVSDMSGGAIVAWTDDRIAGSIDIYTQRVDARYGDWGRPEPYLTGAKDNPHDQGGKVALNWVGSRFDAPDQQTIYQYTIWRAVDAVALQGLAASSIVDQPTTPSSDKPGQRIVWHEHSPQSDYFWELVGSQIADYDTTYSYLASTRQDSVATNPGTHYFRVVAVGSNQFYNWPSNVLSAHSVDNLAPSAPLMLTAQRVGDAVNLKWNHAVAPDLKHYSVYRASASGVTPVPANFLASEDDTVLVDAGAPTSALYYIVTAYDVHANQSAASNEASVNATTGVDDTPRITALSVDNHPNPFTGNTTLKIGLPSRSDVTLEVFDVAGRRVRLEDLHAQSAGWQSVSFDGRDDAGRPLASGVYFYRVHAAGTSVTHKMILVR